MVRKIGIAFILILLLVAVSYLKMDRQQEKVDTAVAGKTGEYTQKLVESEQQLDSLSKQLQSEQLAYSDSLLQKDKAAREIVDSMAYLVEKKDSTIDNLDRQLKDVKKRLASSQKKSGSKQLSLHEKVYRYYKDKYSSLPKDLSEYEKRIAISEIREETARKFSITVKELNNIRDKYKLSY